MDNTESELYNPMKQTLNTKNEKVIRVEVRIPLDINIVNFEFTEEIYSKYLRNGTLDSLKGDVRSRIMTQAVTRTYKEIDAKVTEQLKDEWAKIKSGFPEPLPIREVAPKEKRPRTVRCSRQLTQAELKEQVDKLLSELGDIYG